MGLLDLSRAPPHSDPHLAWGRRGGADRPWCEFPPHGAQGRDFGPGHTRDTWWGSLLLGAWICAINPTLIISWSAVVTTIHGSELIDLAPRHAVPFALGVGGGAASWFLVMVTLLRRYRERFSAQTLQSTVRLLGLLLIGLGVWFAVRFAHYFLA